MAGTMDRMTELGRKKLSNEPWYKWDGGTYGFAPHVGGRGVGSTSALRCAGKGASTVSGETDMSDTPHALEAECYSSGCRITSGATGSPLYDM